MTIYEFFVESTEPGVRLEVPTPGLHGCTALMKRLDQLVQQGHGEATGMSYGELATGLDVAAVRKLLANVPSVHVGVPRTPDPGPLRRTRAAIDELPADTTFAALYFEI